MQADDLKRIYFDMLKALERQAGEKMTSHQKESFVRLAYLHGFEPAKEALSLYLAAQKPGRPFPLAKELDRHIKKIK